MTLNDANNVTQLLNAIVAEAGLIPVRDEAKLPGMASDVPVLRQSATPDSEPPGVGWASRLFAESPLKDGRRDD